MPFRNLGLDAKILHAVQDAGYTEPTPIQTAAIPPLLAGHDLIGIAQTGTGKTAAFTLPILTRLAAPPAPGQRRGTRVLVIAPTRELVLQIEENVRAYAKHLPVSVATVFGGVGEQPQIRALRAATDIVIACPGRLLDLMGRRCADFSRIAIPRARRSRPDARHGFSAGHPAHRAAIAEATADADVLRHPLPRD